MASFSKPSRIAVVGNYVPRRCGIATFTADLCEALAAEFHEATCFALPVNDIEEGYKYPPRVRFELVEQELESYGAAAEFLNSIEADLVSLQHEYGIFGGPAGSHVLTLLRELRMPVVTTLHTVLKQPDPEQRRVLQEIAQLSDRLVVMSRRSIEFLEQIYGVPAGKIDFIPHGIPDVPFVDPNFYKDQFGVEGKVVLLTFGLLSRNKGIETVIRALPEVLERHRNLVYMVVGATHPSVLRREGEAYRNWLKQQARAEGVDQAIIFHNEFVTLEQLLARMGAADIYITPYLSEAQMTSGTLAYNLGAGKAVISTPYWYAQELLAEERGTLVPFGDPRAVAAAILGLLENETARHAMRKRAYLAGRDMVWPKVARAYLETFGQAREDRLRRPRRVFPLGAVRRLASPAFINLDHLRAMTDDAGILQHAVFSVPNYDEGYSTDDNARALILMVLLERIEEPSAEMRALTSRYLAFLWHAFNAAVARFRNFLSYDRRWREEIGSEDSHGRALWALGTVLGRCGRPELRGPAAQLFHRALPDVSAFSSPRAWAFTLLGIHEYMRQFAGDKAAQYARAVLAEKLMDSYRRNGAPDWPWFELIAAYDNARLPHALLVCAEAMNRPDMAGAALRALDWLAKLEQRDGHFAPIGCNGFYVRGGECARFDQQPVETWSMISAALEARRVTGEPRWREAAQSAFDWFLGGNDLDLPLYDPHSGGCRDALQPDRLNQNQGAESTLSFLLSMVELRLASAAARPEDELIAKSA